MVDASAGVEGLEAAEQPRPWEQLRLLQSEVGRYDPGLLRLPSLLVATKVDLLRRPGATLQALRRRTGMRVFPVSSVTGDGYDLLKLALRALVLDSALASTSS